MFSGSGSSSSRGRDTRSRIATTRRTATKGEEEEVVRPRRCDRTRGGRRGRRDAIEREVEMRGKEEESGSLARQSVPTASQHTSTFSRLPLLSFPFFSSSAGPFLFSSPRVLLFQLLPSALSLLLARTHSHIHRCTRATHTNMYLPSLCLVSLLSFTSFSLSTRVSSRTNRTYSSNLGVRVLIIMENDRAEEAGSNVYKDGAGRVSSLVIRVYTYLSPSLFDLAKISPLIVY